jgi:plant 3beta-hydroxysteroid-4alpha-carboxylate 3-dehydrogenase
MVARFIVFENVCYFFNANSEICDFSGIMQPYFVTNEEPVETWEFISCILEGLGYQRYNVSLLQHIIYYGEV